MRIHIRSLAAVALTAAAAAVALVMSAVEAVAPSAPKWVDDLPVPLEPAGVLQPGSTERQCTPVCEAAFEAVYRADLAGWAREIEELTEDVIDEWAEAEG